MKKRYKLKIALLSAAMLLPSTTIMAQQSKPLIGGNVYGGGNEADVKINTYVNMSAGTVSGSVFGGGKGKDDEFACTKAMVGIENTGVTLISGEGESAEYTLLEGGTSVRITNGTVEGNVYGGGEVGRVERNTIVTIGTENNTSLTPIVKGNVFGAGKGVETHGYSALVRGNSTVTIQGKAAVWHNVYGGGEKASVGRYYVALNQTDADAYNVRIGMPCYLKAGGKCTVIIRDDVTIGTEEIDGHVFGAGKGVEPSMDYDYEDEDENDTNDNYNVDVHKPKRMDNTNHWEYFDDVASYLQFVETLGRASETDVTLDEDCTIYGSVYGGSESGFVYKNTVVKIQNGTIEGDAFGGGKGIETYSEAGRVRQNTYLTIIDGIIKGNVYGGGSLGDVGKIVKNFTTYNYYWTDAKLADIPARSPIT